MRQKWEACPILSKTCSCVQHAQVAARLRHTKIDIECMAHWSRWLQRLGQVLIAEFASILWPHILSPSEQQCARVPRSRDKKRPQRGRIRESLGFQSLSSLQQPYE